MATTLDPPAIPATFTDLPLDATAIDDGFNPRTSIDNARLAGMTASVRSVGIIQPIVVTPVDSDQSFRLIAGHRRVAAARAAELERIPSLVLTAIDEQTRLQLALIENLQSEDINPIDEAAGYERALRDFCLKSTGVRPCLPRWRASAPRRTPHLDSRRPPRPPKIRCTPTVHR